jgi:hypothetical protein
VPFVRGRIVAGDDRAVNINDALEILKMLAGMNTVVIESNTRAWNAAQITPASITANQPNILDALEILKFLAGMDSLIV